MRKDLSVVEEADVVVAGGGPGGFPAAIAAARNGAKTVLLERYGFLGGMATAGLVAPILGVHASRGEAVIVQGILKELAERMHALDGAPSWKDIVQGKPFRFDPEALKRAAEDMVSEAGVVLYLHTFAADALREKEKVAALITESKSGRQAVSGSVFIDATGDADIAFRAGADCRKGRYFDGAVQSMGSFFHICGIPEYDEDLYGRIRAAVKKGMEEGKVFGYRPGITGKTTFHGDTFSPNITRCPGDPTDVKDLTHAEITLRRQAWDMIDLIKQEVPECENCYLEQTSPQAAPRESRQVMGKYLLTGEDIREGRKFEDGIARGSWWIDIHCPLGKTFPVHLCVRECAQGDRCAFWRSEHDTAMISREDVYPPEGDWYDIPFRSLVPSRISNLIISGRCISATHEAMAGARVMGTCMAIGQAAGTAAALAAESNADPGALDSSLLREVLTSQGVLV